MADFQFQQQAPGSFINPDYATPEQKEYLRKLAEQLMGSATAQTATSWPGAIAQALQGINAGYYANRARKGDIAEQLLRTNQAAQMQGINPQNQSVPQNPTQPPAQGQGGALGFGEPRGIRNNNPGNIKDSPFAQSQPGYSGRDNGGFAVFQTPEHGQIAMDKLLQNYAGKGLTSPAGIINRWAPPSENDTSGYAATVAKKLGISPTASLNMQDPGVRRQLEEAMATVETGRPMSFAPQANNPLSQAPQRPMQMAQAGSGRPPIFDPATLGALATYGRPDDREAVRQMTQPKQEFDVYGNPILTSPSIGQVRQTVGPGVQPGYRAPTTISRESISTTTPVTPPGAGGTPSYGGGEGMTGLVKTQQDINRSMQFQQAMTQPKADVIKQDMNAATQVPNLLNTINTLIDDIQVHGDNVSWGPQHETMTNIQSMLANYAPGLFSKDQLEGLASANSIAKMSGTLGSMLGRLNGNIGGTDYSMQLSQHQVPGAGNTKQGALALADMIKQRVVQWQQLGEAYAALGDTAYSPGFDPITFRNNWFRSHPVINPITHNPIEQDIHAMQAAESKKGDGGWQEINVNGKTVRIRPKQ